MQFNESTSDRQIIHLAFRQERLEMLIRQGKLHATDFNCLDSSSKRSVWSMLLAAAASRLKNQ
ncbi:MAG: hypothetical protein R3341_07570 [Methylophaga sp.]|nr:hypothetical protein [Methylophaga sp.]